MSADLELTVTLIATISRIEPGQVDLSLVIELDYIHVVTLASVDITRYDALSSMLLDLTVLISR